MGSSATVIPGGNAISEVITGGDAIPVVIPSGDAIPVDLFVSKKHPDLARGELGFVDSSGNIVFRARRVSSSSPSLHRVLLDSSGTLPLISVSRLHSGHWQGFKGGDEGKEMIFRVERTLNKITRTELEVFLARENAEDSTADFKVKGNAFQRSCTIYRGNSIVAQTSLMYKLNQIFVRRNKFRLTIFPGSIDRTVAAALIVIFLD